MDAFLGGFSSNTKALTPSALESVDAYEIAQEGGRRRRRRTMTKKRKTMGSKKRKTMGGKKRKTMGGKKRKGGFVGKALLPATLFMLNRRYGQRVKSRRNKVMGKKMTKKRRTRK
jgi:hypothetical protein